MMYWSNLFNEILDLEERALITGEYKNISVNDMHIINAVGIREQKNMSTVARELNVTVGTLTIAVNNLVKKGYIQRMRSQEDRRVVLISLTEQGKKAYYHHKDFHEKMVLAVLKGLNVEETEALTKALTKLQGFFQIISVEGVKMEYTEKDLVKIAKRENNTKRNYLVVDPLQGKHIPVVPSNALDLFAALADTFREKYKDEKAFAGGLCGDSNGHRCSGSDLCGGRLYSDYQRSHSRRELSVFFRGTQPCHRAEAGKR